MKTKKIISLFFSVVLTISLFTPQASASEIENATNYALSTDITATINGYEIPSYNIDGHIHIIVEDLNHYGFAVTYSDVTRTLGIYRDPSKLWVSKNYVKPYLHPSNISKPEFELIPTNIVTYLNDSYIPSHNINGYTLIRFDALAAFGPVVYSNDKREISLTLQELGYNPTYSFFDINTHLIEYNVEVNLEKYTNLDITVVVRPGSSSITFNIIFNEMKYISQYDKNTFTKAFNQSTPEIINAFKSWKTFLPTLSGVDFVFWECDGEQINNFSISLT